MLSIVRLNTVQRSRVYRTENGPLCRRRGHIGGIVVVLSLWWQIAEFQLAGIANGRVQSTLEKCLDMSMSILSIYRRVWLGLIF